MPRPHPKTLSTGAPARGPAHRRQRRTQGRVRSALGALAVLAAQAAFAAPASWSCWYDGETAILCVAARAHPSPVRWPWKIVRIPILTIPTDIEGLRPLATSVMCGRQSDCTVRLDSLPDGDAIVAALDDD